ncbi:hypothetical protein [Bacillus subtilis]|uniref:hypothetical protein n=1 Tax=Bacillus subtilis TaxID=1423 RepID=UPI002DB622B0|nr:hypothetical protein [Bacillus subtilis]MEC0285549.1 hypothetical protein [Bacillus subtilis]MEC0481512.1 hypothetical protein [Bacillus subtilis]MEC0522230.1 hypothetical protein [Bacillus subtilis]
MSNKIKYLLAIALVITLMVIFRHFLFLLLIKFILGAFLVFIGLVGVYALFRMLYGLISVTLVIVGIMLIFKIAQFAFA